MCRFWSIYLIVTVWLTVLGWYDWSSRRLPNWLTLSGAALFLLLRFWHGGWPGLANGLAGFMWGGAFLLLPFLLRGAGAGDVKMFAAVGALCGSPLIFSVMILTTIFGLLMGLAALLFTPAGRRLLTHWAKCCCCWRYDRKAGRAALGDKGSISLPFGVAIAVGTWTTLTLLLLLPCIRT